MRVSRSEFLQSLRSEAGGFGPGVGESAAEGETGSLLSGALQAHGFSRREFLKFCGGLAAVLGLGGSAVTDIARALEKAAERPPVLWVDFQECLGCTESATKSRYPDFVNLVLDVISLEYSEVMMAGAGEAAERSLADVVENRAGEYVLIVEGSVATKIPNAMTVAGRTSIEIARETIEGAALVIAVGNCAAFGNVQAAHPNPTGAVGMQEFMESEGFDTGKLIALPTCPVNSVHLTTTITYFLTYGELPEKDKWHRPVIHFGKTVHDQCDRRSHFDEGRFVEQLGSPEEDQRFCLYKVGCRGPHTFANCGKVLFNNRSSWCIAAGQCIGCSEKDYWDDFQDFYSPMPGVAIPGPGGVRVGADTIGIGLAAATGVGIAAHFAASAVKGRLGKAEAVEVVEEKEE